MACDVSNPPAGALELGRVSSVASVRIAFFRATVGERFFDAGVTTLVESGPRFTSGPTHPRGTSDAVLGPLTRWM
ncbi:MAG: hypothetical protein ABEH58_02520 [Haloplanus sp.]